jgi:hypothetical protein
LRGRRLPRVGVFRHWTVDQWYHPDAAAREFGDQDWLRQRDEAYLEGNKVWGAWARGITTDQKLFENAKQKAKDASQEADVYDNLILEDLNDRLVLGELKARGFREPFSHGAPYLTISRHEWRVLKLEWPNRATGGGVSLHRADDREAGHEATFSPPPMKPYRGPPMTLGGAATAHLTFMVWCKARDHRSEPDPADQARWYGPETTVLEWRARLVCSRCGSRNVEMVVSGAKRRPLERD